MKTMLLNSLLLCVCATAAQAALTINVNETGGDVVFSGSGTLDVTGATPSGSGSVLPFETYFDPSAPLFYSNPTAGAISLDGYTLTSFVFSIGSGGLQGFNEPAAVATGQAFGLASTNIYVPTGFTSGAFNFTTSIFGTDLATLGITPGTYNWAFPGDSVSMTVTAAVVPEPSTYIAGLGFVALAALMWQRRRKNASASAAT